MSDFLWPSSYSRTHPGHVKRRMVGTGGNKAFVIVLVSLLIWAASWPEAQSRASEWWRWADENMCIRSQEPPNEFAARIPGAALLMDKDPKTQVINKIIVEISRGYIFFYPSREQCLWDQLQWKRRKATQ